MKRTKPSKSHKADAIVTGDWHLREDQPTCRTDDYWTAQWRKIDFIKALQTKHECPVLQPGDFFDHWKPSPRLLAKTFLHMPDHLYVVFGNHDLPQHSFDLRDKSGLFALQSGAPDRIRAVRGGHWDQEVPEDAGLEIRGRRILILHTPVYKDRIPPWHHGARTVLEILQQHPTYDLIVTGDLHDRFAVEHRGRLLVNTGSLMRMTADQINYEPAIYLWYAEDNSVEEIRLPIEKHVISREHLERQEERKARYEAFIERLRQEGDPELSFRANLKRHFKQNSTLSSVRKLIYQMLERENGQPDTAETEGNHRAA